MKINKLFRSKKAQGKGIVMTDEWVLVIILSFVIPLTAMVFAMFVTGYQVQENSYLDDVEDIIIQTRFFNSPECFAYQDPTTERVYPGVIDAAKFNQQILDSCYNVPEDYLSGFFWMELKDIDRKKNMGVVESKNYGYNLVRSTVETEPFFVLIRDGEKIYAGELSIRSES